MSRYTLTESSPPVPEGISCRFFLVDEQQVERHTILIAAFEGTYPEGSLGNAHGKFIAYSGLQGVHGFDADCLVLDFRELQYQWGNTLLKVFQDISMFRDGELEPGEPAFPIIVVTSEKSKAAFLSLVTSARSKKEPEWHFDDIDAAIQYAVKKVEEWFAY